MADEKNLAKARQVYEQMCRVYEEQDLKFQRYDENLAITLGMQGKDLPMEFIIMVMIDQQVVRLGSCLPGQVPEDKLTEALVAANYVNNKILNGTFSCDVEDGSLSFNLANAFHDSLLGDKVFAYMLYVAASMVDRYNDLFLMLSKGMITAEQFIEYDIQRSESEE